MKAIVAKYLAPTTHRGSRIKVFAEGWEAITEGVNNSMDFDQQAKEMAYRLLEKNTHISVYCPEHKYTLIHGTLPSGDLVFCLG